MKLFFGFEQYPNPQERAVYPSSGEILQPDWLLYMPPAGVEKLRDACIKESAEKELAGSKFAEAGGEMLVEVVVKQVKKYHAIQEMCRDVFKFGKTEAEAKDYFKKYIQRDIEHACSDDVLSKLLKDTLDD